LPWQSVDDAAGIWALQVKGVPDPMGDYIKTGAWNVDDVQGGMIEKFKQKYGLK